MGTTNMIEETATDIVLLTAIELAVRWKLYKRDGTTPNAGRIAYLIESGELPGAFRLRLGGDGRGAREWRIPMADVFNFERRHRAGDGRSNPGSMDLNRKPKARPTIVRPPVTGTDGKDRLASKRGRLREHDG
jgi:hypothetical protein